MYIYADESDGVDIDPNPGETYQAFVARVKPALITLGIGKEDDGDGDDDVQEVIDSAWSEYVLENATCATVTLEREVDDGSIYNDPWMTPWKVAQIHTATLPTITFSSMEMAQASSGDEFQIAKTKPEKQMVFGWANIAKDAEGNFPLDWDGDITQPTDLEDAAYTFVLKHRVTGENHEGEAVGELVESIMFTKEKQEALGIPEGVVPEGWWVGFHIPDKEVFAKVKKGEYGMFSVQGVAKRIPTGK